MVCLAAFSSLASMRACDALLPMLAAEWSEDAEAMPEDRRQALLDAVRERVDEWVGNPTINQHLATRVHEYLAPRMAPRFGLPPHEMRMLCDEAGYSV